MAIAPRTSSTSAKTASTGTGSSSSSTRIPRPLNSFMLYRRALLEQAKAAATPPNHAATATTTTTTATTKQGAFSRVASARWAQEPASVKAHFAALAAHEKLAHQKAYPGYKYQPQSKAQKLLERAAARAARQAARQKAKAKAAAVAAAEAVGGGSGSAGTASTGVAGGDHDPGPVYLSRVENEAWEDFSLRSSPPPLPDYLLATPELGDEENTPVTESSSSDTPDIEPTHHHTAGESWSWNTALEAQVMAMEEQYIMFEPPS